MKAVLISQANGVEVIELPYDVRFDIDGKQHVLVRGTEVFYPALSVGGMNNAAIPLAAVYSKVLIRHVPVAVDANERKEMCSWLGTVLDKHARTKLSSTQRAYAIDLLEAEVKAGRVHGAVKRALAAVKADTRRTLGRKRKMAAEKRHKGGKRGSR